MPDQSLVHQESAPRAPAPAPAPATAVLRRELLLLSCAALFWELTMIRYVPGSVRVVGYFTNLVLLSSFLGLGVGTLLGDRLREPLRWFSYVVAGGAWLILALGMFDSSNVSGELIWLGGPVDSAASGDTSLYARLRAAAAEIGPVPAAVTLPAVMLITASMFVPLGAAIGARFTRLDPLSAYSWDIGGSLAGIAIFTALSAMHATPLVWFAVGFALVTPLALRLRHAGRLLWTGAAVGAALAAWLLSSAFDWSPYQKIGIQAVTLEHLGETGDQVVGYELKVNNDYHQMMLDLGPTAVGHPALEAWRDLYDAPYRAGPHADVLILGAGTGNDVRAALRAGAEHVTAVEIDPVILDAGRRLHPERPYDDPRVEVVNDDARAYFKRTERQFDAIVFGFLDSHTLLSSMSSVRIDTFVYTLESFQEARRLLRPGGRVTLTFAAGTRWVGDRLFRMFEAVFGAPPEVVHFQYTNGFVFRSPPAGAVLEDVAAPEAARSELPTDDWPYFYLRERSVPGAYVLFLVLALLLGTVPLFVVPRRDRRMNVQFLLLGAAFMLIETQSVTEMALLFGSTWRVNAIAFGGVLAMVFLANLTCRAWPGFPVAAAYALVGACILVRILVPPSALLPIAAWARVPLAVILLFGPIYFAGIAFSSSFRRTESANVSFGSNLLGAMIGGGLEYSSMVLGFGALSYLALALYGMAYVAFARMGSASETA